MSLNIIDIREANIFHFNIDNIAIFFRFIDPNACTLYCILNFADKYRANIILVGKRPNGLCVFTLYFFYNPCYI